MNNEIQALRRVAQILAEVSTPIERQYIARRVEQKIKGDDSELALSLTHAAALFWPGDVDKTAEVLQQLTRAFDAGELGNPHLRAHRHVLFIDLTVWPDCPTMAADSPLRYWVPDVPKAPQVANMVDYSEGVAMPVREGFVEIPSDVRALPISKLGYILASAMHDPESDDENEGVRHACEMMHFDDVIQQALRNGQLTPRAPGTCLPMAVTTPSSVVTVQDLARYLGDIQCGVQIRRIERRQAAPQAATPEPVEAESASNALGTGKVWTLEKLAEVREYREKHGTKKTAAHYQVSEQRIRKLLPGEKPKAKGYSAFTHHIK